MSFAGFWRQFVGTEQESCKIVGAIRVPAQARSQISAALSFAASYSVLSFVRVAASMTPARTARATLRRAPRSGQHHDRLDPAGFEPDLQVVHLARLHHAPTIVRSLTAIGPDVLKICGGVAQNVGGSGHHGGPRRRRPPAVIQSNPLPPTIPPFCHWPK